jgi:hydroxypyruvate reductase
VPHDRELIERRRTEAREIFLAGVAAADPAAAVRRALELGPSGRPVLVGEELSQQATLRIVAFGKAAVTMAEAAAELLSAEAFEGVGIAIVDRLNRRPVDRFQVHVGGHPTPDAAGLAGAQEIRRYLEDCDDGDGLLVLISGGGSALLVAPADGITIEDKVATTRLLLRSGATIHELNAVRKHLSALKGGGLARQAAPSYTESLILSDVPGDDLSTIASGPTAPDPSTFAEAHEVLTRHALLADVPLAVRLRLEKGLAGEIAETPGEGDPVFEHVRNRLVGSNRQSLEAAEKRAASLGYRTVLIREAVVGEARGAGARLADRLHRALPATTPLAILAGGETTVRVRGDGKGGRNQEMTVALALACETLGVEAPWVFLSGGTDGRDGPTDAAGGLVDPDSLARMRAAGLAPRGELDNNNTYALLQSSEDLLLTGGTGTNVADLQVLLLG